jgi:endonuclease-3
MQRQPPDGSKAATTLSRILDRLRSVSGRPKKPPSDPFALILLENVAYLADDARRDEAFRILTDATALSPERILAAPTSLLRNAARRGILPDDRVERLREIAAIALDDFGGDLDAVVRRPTKDAMKALRRFPSIGEPGAEKILLFAGRLAVLALESNGLRVLLRLGFGKEEKSYSGAYRSAQSAAQKELPAVCGPLVEAHLLLRRHGKEVCRRAAPLCERCSVTAFCEYFRAVANS